MRTSFLILFSLTLFTFNIVSCDKVAYPYIIKTNLDTTLYPGNFRDYDFPTFESNPNTLRNALIEDYTGHRCTYCPNAAIVAHDIEEANPGRAFVASIHAGSSANGVTSFQEVLLPDYPTNFMNDQGLDMGATFFQEEVGFAANPMGNINRFKMDALATDNFFYTAGNWTRITDSVLTTTLDVNITAKSSYFEESHGMFLHTNIEFLNNLEGTYNVVVYAIENERYAPQLDNGEYIPAYKHHNIHIGNLYDETWGRLVSSGSTAAGTAIRNDFSYKLPETLSKENMHFLIMVINRETYEVIQVIKHEL